MASFEASANICTSRAVDMMKDVLQYILGIGSYRISRSDSEVTQFFQSCRNESGKGLSQHIILSEITSFGVRPYNELRQRL